MSDILAGRVAAVAKVKEAAWGIAMVVVVWLFMGYQVSLVVAVPLHNWAYAQKHGVRSWLAGGEVVATLRAVAWPLFLNDA